VQIWKSGAPNRHDVFDHAPNILIFLTEVHEVFGEEILSGVELARIPEDIKVPPGATLC